ncbi:MAG: 16S rRNA (guanine(527)-N(7))-methyltransferase RsmG [Deltaproteobacteria bacterium]|nr:16S rRNA (guanine(527)-N(7))-methyltransferase RsmG [Deltaproteobacteria bacterium]
MKRPRGHGASKSIWKEEGDFSRLWTDVARVALFPVPPGLGVSLARYRDELRRFNERINLIRVRSDREFAARHLLDALAGLPLLPDRGRVVDVGSGAGIPGLVLALARPDLAFTLVESIAKKAAFLSHARRALTLDNVTIFAGRFEDASLDDVSLFTARAVADPRALVQLVRTRSDAPIVIWTRPNTIEENAERCIVYGLPDDDSDRAVMRIRASS